MMDPFIEASPDGRELRVPPLSSGEFAGRFVAQMPAITVMAIELAVSGMTIGQVMQLRKSEVYLCVYEEQEFEGYVQAYEQRDRKWQQASPGEDNGRRGVLAMGVRTPDAGLLSQDGS